MFGRQARHLISSEKRYRESNPGSAPVLESESLKDGWYVDAAGLPSEKNARAGLHSCAGDQPPVIRVKHTGPAVTGLAIRERITSHSVGGPAGRDTREMTFEVTDLVEGSLSQTLFEPPPGFQRVTRFPDDYRRSMSYDMEMYWQWFQDWLRDLFS